MYISIFCYALFNLIIWQANIRRELIYEVRDAFRMVKATRVFVGRRLARMSKRRRAFSVVEVSRQNMRLLPTEHKEWMLLCWLFLITVEDLLLLKYSARATQLKVGRDSSVGIVIRCGLDGPGIESRWRRDFPSTSRPALRPTQPPIQWVPGPSRG
jgi:hypothetical protein